MTVSQNRRQDLLSLVALAHFVPEVLTLPDLLVIVAMDGPFIQLGHGIVVGTRNDLVDLRDG